MKYVFLLTFCAFFNNRENTAGIEFISDQEELNYSDIQEAKKNLKNTFREQMGYELQKDLLLLNCTRVLNDK